MMRIGRIVAAWLVACIVMLSMAGCTSSAEPGNCGTEDGRFCSTAGDQVCICATHRCAREPNDGVCQYRYVYGGECVDPLHAPTAMTSDPTHLFCTAGDADADADADDDGSDAEDSIDEGGPRCGDGTVDLGEDCDDENTIAGDGCEDNCRYSCRSLADCDDPCRIPDLCESGDWGQRCAYRDAPDFTNCGDTTDATYEICVDGSCVSPGCGNVSCNPPGPSFQPPDTNQRLCFDGSAEVLCDDLGSPPSCSLPFCGQDAQYGLDHDDPGAIRFETIGSEVDRPVIHDTVTNLDWQGCVRGQTGTSCTGTALPYNIEMAKLECDNPWSGLSGWRLPDIHELLSLVDYGRGTTPPTIDTAVFPNFPTTSADADNARLWSSTTDALLLGRYWYFDVKAFGSGAWDGSTNDEFVLCVRNHDDPLAVGIPERFSGPTSPSTQWVVADNVTGVVWQGCAYGALGSDCSDGSPARQTWEQALATCQGSGWAGEFDWYLPNMRELSSLIDTRENTPATDSAVFPNAPAERLWSSTPRSAGTNTWVFVVDFVAGNVGLDTANETHAFRCVRKP